MIWWVLLLYFGGLILVFLEFFVPGGVCGTFGVVSMIASCVLGCYHYPQYALFIVLAELAGGVLGVVLGITFFPRTRIGKVMVLQDMQKASEGWVSVASDLSLVGAIGEAATQLRPAGTIIVNGKRLDAVSGGELIEKGSKIRVLEVYGSRIVVEELEVS